MDLVALNCDGSGHAGGSLSIMDITAALYLRVASHDPKNPEWDDRDRIIFSAGHKAPALYMGLGISGYYPFDDVVLLRQYNSMFQGHPHWLKTPGVEVSTGSLGQGLGLAVGMALRGKLDKKNYYVYVVTGDGEWDEGSMWESAMEACHYKLDNLIVILDRNYLQIDGKTEDVMRLDPLNIRLASFGFEVIPCDGHDMVDILRAFNQAKRTRGKPALIYARTIKGKGVSFMENQAGWHGKAPDDTQLEKGLCELGLEKVIDVFRLKKKAADYKKRMSADIEHTVPKFTKRSYFWNSADNMKITMEPTRFGFGKALANKGSDPRVVCVGLDISDSVQISKFYDGKTERKTRFLSMGIAEQSATTVAGGLSREGKLPVVSTYGVFLSQRNADQMRTSICYGNLNVLFGGAHGGVSVGADGATHQSLEEISVVGILPNMTLIVPSDSIETRKAVEYSLMSLKGPKYIRFAREATPIVTDQKTPFVFGKANIIRFRNEKPLFIDAFETILSSSYRNEGESVAIIACGPMVPEAMRAAWILKVEKGIETRVINVHTVKPLDKETIIKAAKDVNIIITSEEHQKGGFGNQVASIVMEANLKHVPKFAMIGVNDRFGESGAPWDLMKAFGLTAEFIAKKVLDLL